MGSPVIPYLAQGPTPVQPVDVLGNVAKIAGIQATRAATAESQARIPQIQAQTQQIQAGTQATQAATQGQQIQNALTQRQLDAQKALVGLLQQNTTKNPDGSTSTDMATVLGKYRAMYPDYALALEQRQLELENQRTTAAKNEFDLASAQQKNLGFTLGMGGFGDPQTAANDPQIAQKYSNVYAKAQQNGTAHYLPVSPQDFSKNPQAWIPKLTDFVSQSGAASDVLAQKSAAIDAFQKQLGQARTMHAQGLVNVSTPQDYAQLYQTESKTLDPKVFAALNLPPPNTVTTPEAIASAKQSAAMSQMAPDERVKYLESVRHDKAQEIAQQISAAASASQAATAAGELGLKRFESSQVLGPGALQTGGGGGGAAVPSGVPAQPAVSPGAPGNGVPVRVAAITTNGAPPQATKNPAAAVTPPGKQYPVLTVDGKQIDLNGSSPIAREWQSKSPLIQNMALRLLDGSSSGTGPGMGGIPNLAATNAAADLASKINPHYAQQAKAREALWGNPQAQQMMVSANTAIQHSDQLLDAAQKLGTGNFRPTNRLTIFKNIETGKEEPTDFENIRDRYVAELQRYYQGGAITEGELNKAADLIGAANSYQQIQGAVKNTNRLLLSGMQERDVAYNDINNGGILGNRQSFVTPESTAILKKQGIIRSVTPAQLADYATKKFGSASPQNIQRARQEAKAKNIQIEGP